MRAPAEKVVFDHTVEGLFFKALGNRLTPRIKERLREVGIDLDAKRLQAAYPFESWMAALRIATDEVFPGMEHGEAMFKMGELMIAGYQQTVMGKALLGMMRVLGPKRILQRAQQSFRSANNYTETRLTEVDETTMDVWVNHIGTYPTFTSGLLYAGVCAAGAKNAEVKVLDFDGREGATFRVSWSR
ncbi:MAG: DUF2378 family protein [Myxococcota bacterium]|nr:DUF2378 family protein [Myxococcota bacterium]